VSTVAAAYRAAGWRVIGVCPSARAARELEHGGGVVSFTVPRFHHHVERHPLEASTLVIVDEAGMCGTADLESIVSGVRGAGSKVILVGDHRQLPEVAAGGGFAAAVDLLGDQACELTINRRQHDDWEIHALGSSATVTWRWRGRPIGTMTES
jgi:ATP-dependent exoDNAse (exonuclease V) alpha subunit